MARKGRSQSAQHSLPRKVESKPLRPSAPQPVQRFFVVIENLMPQALEVSVLDESGSVEGLRLPPRGKSRPIEAHRVGSFTGDLERQGRVRIINQNG